MKFTITNVGAAMGGEAFLLCSANTAIMIDSGFAFSAPQMIVNIKKQLNGRSLDYVLISHSHYDHVGGLPYILEQWPEVQVFAGTYAANIFKRKSALTLMRQLNDFAALEHGFALCEDKLNHLRIDTTVEDGDVLTLGDFTFEVWETPGHTKCSIAFYCPEENLVLASETIGVWASDTLVVPAFLTEYDGVINFIARIQQKNITQMFIPHIGLLTKERCTSFIENALYWNQTCKENILSWHKMGYDKPRMMQEFSTIFYNDFMKKIHPQKAYEINTGHTIDVILNHYT